MKPKIGQKYICIKDVESDKSLTKGGGGGYEPGRIFTCSRVTEHSNTYILWPDDEGNGIWHKAVIPYGLKQYKRKKLKFHDTKV
jgi:hypothetical protein